MHSADRNPWTQVAKDAGAAIDRTPPAWRSQFADLGFSRAEQAEAAKAFADFDQRLRAAPPPSDCAADALEPGNEVELRSRGAERLHQRRRASTSSRSPIISPMKTATAA